MHMPTRSPSAASPSWPPTGTRRSIAAWRSPESEAPRMVELFEVGSEDVDDLVGYLARVAGERDEEWKSADLWRSRLRMWWDLNPALSGRTPRGWGLRDGG